MSQSQGINISGQEDTVAAHLSFRPSVLDRVVLFQHHGSDGGPRDAGYQIVKFLRRLATRTEYKVMADKLKSVKVCQDRTNFTAFLLKSLSSSSSNISSLSRC